MQVTEKKNGRKQAKECTYTEHIDKKMLSKYKIFFKHFKLPVFFLLFYFLRILLAGENP